MSFDLITMGRIGVDLYPEQIGVPLAEVRTFRKMLGGTATNVAVAAARLGRRTAVITKVGDDPFGGYIRGALGEFGVDARFVGTDPALRTPLAFCEIHPPDDFPLLFYRRAERARSAARARRISTRTRCARPASSGSPARACRSSRAGPRRSRR